MEKQELSCEIEINCPEIIAIRGTSKLNAVIDWELVEESRGITLTIADQNYEAYYYLIYEKLIKNPSKDVIKIIALHKHAGYRILSLELENPQWASYSRGTYWGAYKYSITYKKMLLRLDRKDNNAEANLFLAKSCIDFFNGVLFRHFLNPFDKNNFEILNNHEGEKIVFENVTITPKYEMFLKKQPEANAVVLIKEPILRIALDSGKWESKTYDYCEIACCLISIYSQRYIYPWVWNIEGEEYYEKIVDYEKYALSKIHPLFEGINFKEWNVYTFINSANLERCTKFKKELLVITESRIRAYHSWGITRFMMLFIIIEMIKDMYLQDDGKQGMRIEKYEYRFIKPNAEVNKTISEAFETITSLVDDADKESFKERKGEIHQSLKTKTMRYQFEELFAKLKINVVEKYNFNFKEATKIRNSIFHGEPLTHEEEVVLEDIIHYSKMSLLANDLTYSFFLNLPLKDKKNTVSKADSDTAKKTIEDN